MRYVQFFIYSIMKYQKKILFVFLVSYLLLVSLEAKGKIRTIDQSNFEAFTKDNSYWIIQISQSKCPGCQQHQEELLDTAELLQGVCKIGKVDAKFLQGMKIQKNPTYVFLRSDNLQENVQFKDQKISKVSLAKFCMDQIQKAIKKRHKTLFGQGNKNTDHSKSKQKNQQSEGTKNTDYSKVIELTDKNFQKTVLSSKQAWFVQFYSPSCGHCKNLQPQYNKLPAKMGQKVRIAKIDATVHRQTASKYQIKGFPTMLLFDIEDKQKPITYEGQRSAQDISQWLNSQKLSKVKKQLHELNEKNYKWFCNKNIVCNIFILDDVSQKSKLKFIKDILEEDVDKPIQYFYSLRLPTFESLLMIQDRSCPKMVSTWQGINSYRVYNQEFSQQGLRKYITGLMDRRKWIKFQQPSNSLLFAKNQQL